MKYKKREKQIIANESVKYDKTVLYNEDFKWKSRHKDWSY